MSDNVELNPGTGGAFAAADEVDGVHYQIVKIDLGGDGVSQPVAGTLPVSGTVSVGNFPATQPVSGTVSVGNFPEQTGLTDAQLRSAPVPVDNPGAAQDATVQALNTLNDTMLVLLAAILEKMPRVTGNDQVAASIETIPAISIAANQDLRNITGAVANITSIGGKPASTTADALAMAGTQHIYSNITVSA